MQISYEKKGIKARSGKIIWGDSGFFTSLFFSPLPSPEIIPEQSQRERGEKAQPAFPEPRISIIFSGYSPNLLKKHRYFEWIGCPKEKERNLGDKFK